METATFGGRSVGYATGSKASFDNAQIEYDSVRDSCQRLGYYYSWQTH